MAEIDVSQVFEATLIFRAHSSHSAAGCVCFPGPKFPVLPLPCLAFTEYKLQHEEVPSARLCCRAASLPLALSVGSFGFPLKPSLAPGLWQCSSAASTANPTFAGALGLGAQTCPPAAPEPLLSPAGKRLFTNVLDQFVTKIAAGRPLNTQRAFKIPSDPGNVLGTSFLL